MKALVSLLAAALLLLSGCSAKVLHVVENESYRAVFTDASCNVKPVLDSLASQAQMAIQMGMDPAKVNDIVKSFKRGDVTLKATGEQRQFCYRAENDVAYIIDDQGSEGPISLAKK